MLISDSQLAIIGAGASAVCVLEAIVETGVGAGRLWIFEATSQLWCGGVYGPDLDTMRVNIPPDGMSTVKHDSQAFLRWLSARDDGGHDHADYVDPFCDLTFVPRALYGSFLEERAVDAIRRLRWAGWNVSVVQDAVVDVQALDDGRLGIDTQRGASVRADHVILCMGRCPRHDIYGLSHSPGYLADPYPAAENLRDVDADARVGVIGTGLSAVDVALGLFALGHRGPVSLMSRSGVLPAVRRRRVAHRFQHMSAGLFRNVLAAGDVVSADELRELLALEFAAAGVDLAHTLETLSAPSGLPALDLLAAEFRAANTPEVGLQILQHAVPSFGPELWNVLADELRTAAVTTYYRTILRYCCPMPPQSACTLLAAASRGQLTVMQGLSRVDVDQAIGAFEAQHSAGTTEFDCVVNATSAHIHSGKAPPSHSGLVHALLERGLAVSHPRGGLMVDPLTSSVITNQGDADCRIFAVGDLAAGTMFFTFGMPSLVDRARDVVDAITQRPATVPI